MNEDLRFVYKHYRIPTLNAIFSNEWGDDKREQRTIREGTSSDLCELRHYSVTHYTRGKSDWEPAIYGGLTICYVYRGDEMVAIGEAQCSTKDQFCYRIGRMIARGRALKELEKCQRKSASTK